MWTNIFPLNFSPPALLYLIAISKKKTNKTKQKKNKPKKKKKKKKNKKKKKKTTQTNTENIVVTNLQRKIERRNYKTKKKTKHKKKRKEEEEKKIAKINEHTGPERRSGGCYSPPPGSKSSASIPARCVYILSDNKRRCAIAVDEIACLLRLSSTYWCDTCPSTYSQYLP